MSDTNYPPRGEMNVDKSIYTHTDGSVHEVVKGASCCTNCSFLAANDCDKIPCATSTRFKHIAGAYVPSELEVLKADSCEMARQAIYACEKEPNGTCALCWSFKHHTCIFRKWLGRCGDASAWEVK